MINAKNFRKSVCRNKMQVSVIKVIATN